MADPYEEAWNQMLLQRQKARQLEQKVCLGLELAPAFLREPGFFLFLHRHHQALLEIEPLRSGFLTSSTCFKG